MKRDYAIEIADRAASSIMIGKAARLSLRFGGGVTPAQLGAFVEAAPEAGAEALYLFGCRKGSSGDAPIKPYAQVERTFWVACEIFRATFLALLVFVREADALEDEKRRAAAGSQQGRFGGRAIDDRAPGMAERTTFSRPGDPPIAPNK